MCVTQVVESGGFRNASLHQERTEMPVAEVAVHGWLAGGTDKYQAIWI
jgi:hypothetical protein